MSEPTTRLHRDHQQTTEPGLVALAIYLSNVHVFRVERNPDEAGWLFGVIVRKAEFEQIEREYNDPATTLTNAPKIFEAYEAVLRHIEKCERRGGRFTDPVKN